MSNELFRLIRIQNRMSQRQFADRIGISKTLVALIETNERPVSKTTKMKVMSSLSITEDDLELLAKMQSRLKGGEVNER